MSSSGAWGAINNLERLFENGGKRKIVIDTTSLDIAVDGGEATGEGSGGGPAGSEATVRYKGRSH